VAGGEPIESGSGDDGQAESLELPNRLTFCLAGPSVTIKSAFMNGTSSEDTFPSAPSGPAANLFNGLHLNNQL
jgi:hypothetical protein